MLRAKAAAALLTGFCFIAPSQANTVSYYLDQSNKLADGINYLKVTVSDGDPSGDIKFTVEALQPLLDLAGGSFGIKKFGFNVLGGVGAQASDVDALPDGWQARNGGRMDGFGLFDITLKTHGKKNVQDPLTFSITGVDFDTFLSYVDLSTGRSPQGWSLFSAKVTGINFGHCGGGKDGKDGKDGKKGPSGASDSDGPSGGGKDKCVTTAYFGGNSTATPAPPALWLLGTGIVGLMARRFRSAKAPA